MFLEQLISILLWFLKIMWHWRLDKWCWNTALITGINYILIYINRQQLIVIILHIFIFFLCIFNEINEALESRRDSKTSPAPDFVKRYFNIHISAFGKGFYPKQLTLYSMQALHQFMHSWELNPWPWCWIQHDLFSTLLFRYQHHSLKSSNWSITNMKKAELVTHRR